MADLITRTISIPFDYVCSVTAVSKSTSFPLSLEDGTDSSVAFELDVASSGHYSTYFGGSSNIYNVTKVEIEFWHNYASTGPDTGNPIHTVQFKQMNDSRRPSTHATASDLLSDIDTGASFLDGHILKSRQKTLERVTLGDDPSDLICQYIETRLQGGDWLAIGLQAYNADTGDAEIGNLNTLEDTGDAWREADDGEISSPPRLIVTWQESYDDSIVPQFSMKYTTADPTSNQETPSNSTGGYIAPNSIYTTGKIDEFLSSTQTYVQLSDDTTIPETSGLVQIGPEVMRYGSSSDANKQLLSVIRGVSPNQSYPSSVVPTREVVSFLEIDNLFDNRPTDELVKYRCIALVLENTDTSGIQVALRQSSDSDVQVDIGIEIPEYDIREDTLDAAMSSSNVLTMSGECLTYPRGGATLEAGSDLYEGGYVVVDYNGTADMAKIKSFDVNDTQTQGTFIIDRTLTYAAGTPVRILSAPAQRFSNDNTSPVTNSGRFLGFFSDGGADKIDSLRDGGSTFRDHDAFYVWIKSTLTPNKKTSSNTGAIIYVKYEYDFVSDGDAS